MSAVAGEAEDSQLKIVLTKIHDSEVLIRKKEKKKNFRNYCSSYYYLGIETSKHPIPLLIIYPGLIIMFLLPNLHPKPTELESFNIVY